VHRDGVDELHCGNLRDVADLVEFVGHPESFADRSAFLLFLARPRGKPRVTKVEILPPVDRFLQVTGSFHPAGPCSHGSVAARVCEGATRPGEVPLSCHATTVAPPLSRRSSNQRSPYQ